MNFYKRFMGDIQAKTGHLSLAEFGAYDRLLDHYYATEQGLPGDLNGCCRIARAMSKDERKAVESVLHQFFTLSDGIYTQGRTEEMIAEAQPKIAAAKTNGAKGGRPKKNPNETHEKPIGFSNGTQGKPDSIPSQSQSQSQTSSLRSEREQRASRLPADWTLPDEWREWAKAERPDLDPDRTAEKFADYWRGVGGAKGRKLDWLATWRNWVREERSALSASAVHAQESFRERDARAAAERVAAFAPDIAARMPSKTNFSPEIEDVTAIDRY